MLNLFSCLEFPWSNNNSCWPYITVVYSIDALDVLCTQLTRDLFAIAKFLLLLISLLVDPQCTSGSGQIIGKLPSWDIPPME